MSREKIASKSIDGTVLTIDFNDAQVDNLIVDYNSFSDEMKMNLGLHGLSQKIGDSYSGAGGNVAEAAKLAGVVASRLSTDQWRVQAEGGTKTPLEVIVALFRFMERSGDAKTMEDCTDAVIALQESDAAVKEETGKSGGKIRGLRQQLNEIIQEIRLEKAKEKTPAAGVDAAGLFN